LHHTFFAFFLCFLLSLLSKFTKLDCPDLLEHLTYLKTNGVITASTGWIYSSNIPITPLTKIYEISGFTTASINANVINIGIYYKDGTLKYVQGTATFKTIFSDLVDHIVLSGYNTDFSAITVNSYGMEGVEDYVSAQLSTLNGEFINIYNAISKNSVKDLSSKTSTSFTQITGSYLKTDGTIHAQDASWFYSSNIPITPLTKIYEISGFTTASISSVVVNIGIYYKDGTLKYVQGTATFKTIFSDLVDHIVLSGQTSDFALLTITSYNINDTEDVLIQRVSNIDSINQEYIDTKISDVNCGWFAGRCDYLTKVVTPSAFNIGKQYLYLNGSTLEMHIIKDANTRISFALPTQTTFTRAITGNTAALNIGCWGDSIMAGTTINGVGDWNINSTSNWILNLKAKLIADGHTNVSLIGYAQGGIRADTLLTYAKSHTVGACNICIMMLGMNDTAGYGLDVSNIPLGETFRKTYRENMEALISYVFTQTGCSKLMLAVPYPVLNLPAFTTLTAARIATIPLFNICRQEIRDIVENNTNIRLVRADYAMREADETWILDGIHPIANSQGTEHLAQAFRDVLTYEL